MGLKNPHQNEPLLAALYQSVIEVRNTFPPFYDLATEVLPRDYSGIPDDWALLEECLAEFFQPHGDSLLLGVIHAIRSHDVRLQ